MVYSRKLTEESVAPGYPKLISNDWDGLPGNLDAGFTWTNNKTYIFRFSSKGFFLFQWLN